MPLPFFNNTADLPLGIHQATLPETLARFGSGSPSRKVLALRLARIYRIASETGNLARFVVFGSFVTARLEPNDVDVFMVVEIIAEGP